MYKVMICCMAKNGNVLGIVNTKTNAAIMPSGVINLGEVPRNAAARVLKEATGFDVAAYNLQIAYQITDRDDKLMLVYYCPNTAVTAGSAKILVDAYIDWVPHKMFFIGDYAAINKEIISHI